MKHTYTYMLAEQNEILKEKGVDRMANVNSRRVTASSYREESEKLRIVKTDPPIARMDEVNFPLP
jgi:hypothetical protein